MCFILNSIGGKYKIETIRVRKELHVYLYKNIFNPVSV